MTAAAKPRVLLVDDEPQILEGLRDVLHRSFETVLAVGGHEAEQRLDDSGPFAVVVSDLRMPVMSGSAVLAIARQKAPEATRILLTGYADVDAAIEAINMGRIFRFLTKPCPKDTLLQALAAGVAQYRLVVADRVLVEETLRGVVEALSNTLALADPAAFGRATRLRERAARLARAAGMKNVWEVEVAAMLSQVGCLTLPDATATRYYFGETLDVHEQTLVDEIPLRAAEVIAGIPRLEGVSEILQGQIRLGGTFVVSRSTHVLRIVHDADVLEAQRLAPEFVVATLRGRDLYDEELLELYAVLSDTDVDRVLCELPLGEVCSGMTFVRDVTSVAGVLLVSRGQTVGVQLLERIAQLPPQIQAIVVIVAAPPVAVAV